MPYSTQLLLLIASLPVLQSDKESQARGAADADLRKVIEPALEKVYQLVSQFCQQRVTPTQACCFEQQLREELRELGRNVAQWTYNQVEPAVATLPKHVWFEASEYTRLNEKTPQNVWTLFGQIRLWRVGYRPTTKTGDATIFPLAMSLGLVQGATPAVAERASWFLGSSGMTQSQTLERLRQDHGVGWGVKKLRQVTAAVSQALVEEQHDVQVDKLLEWLKQASASTGKHKPVLSVGRDGITLGTRCQGGSVFEVATTGTVTVLDRHGRRLGTVYLAYTPEFGQKTMSTALTRLLQDVVRRWQGPLPRLAYVTDAGDNETTYYDKVLKRMKHPVTGTKLEWIRVVDYYHASERVWKMAELLFSKGQQATSWARKMQKWLLKPGGVNRVLHSAAALRDLYHLRGAKLQDFGKAYRYLRDRMPYMRYAEYRTLGIPRGSGVTEAACKTVYTQRLKLSGMRWTRPGAQTILNLRVLQLSGVWQAAYQATLERFNEPQVRGQTAANTRPPRKAA
ncbi:MAG: hypothetical protein ABR585_14470 [Gemmatimonadaceae bacterium]